MMPEALAAASVSPLPCDTATDRELGRQTMTTGTPIRSRPVTLATRVMPSAGSNGCRRATVSSGDTARCVPSRKRLTPPPSLARAAMDCMGDMGP